MLDALILCMSDKGNHRHFEFMSVSDLVCFALILSDLRFLQPLHDIDVGLGA